jgi:hypothetical protein
VLSLVLKDFIIVRREKSILFMLILSLSMPLSYIGGSGFGLFLAILPAYYLSGWACAADFKYKSDRFLRSMPVSSTAIVAGRYVSVILAWAATFGISAVTWVALSLAGFPLSLSMLPYAAILSLALTLAAHAVYFGGYYVLGYQNARWAIFFVFAAIGVVGAILGGSASSGLSFTAPAVSKGSALGSLLSGDVSLGVYAAILIAGCGLYAISFIASAAAYRRKEF